MNYTPKGNKPLSITITAALLASALIFSFFSSLENNTFLTDFLHILSFTSFLSALLFVSRYLAFEYMYELQDFEFVIYKTTKTTKKAVCRLPYSDITDSGKTQNFTKAHGVSFDMKYNYCITPFCKKTYSLIYETNGKTEMITVEYDDLFVSKLEKYLKNDIILP